MPNAPPKYRPAGYKPPTYSDTRISLYGTQRWREYSTSYRRAHPLCVECERQNIVKPAKLVDHIKPTTDENDPLFWEPRNHQSLCQSCHNKKTFHEDKPAGTTRRRG